VQLKDNYTPLCLMGIASCSIFTVHYFFFVQFPKVRLFTIDQVLLSSFRKKKKKKKTQLLLK